MILAGCFNHKQKYIKKITKFENSQINYDPYAK